MGRVGVEPGAAARAARISSLVEALDWSALSQRLTRYAYVATRKRSIEVAEDLAQTAMTQVLDPKYIAWDPEREPDIFDHLKNVVRGLVSNKRRRRQEQRVVPTDLDTIDDFTAAAEPTPEEQLAERDLAARVEAGIARMFEGDPLVLKLVALACEGTTTPREQAAATGASYDDVRNARKRLFRGTAELAKELALGQEVQDGG